MGNFAVWFAGPFRVARVAPKGPRAASTTRLWPPPFILATIFSKPGANGTILPKSYPLDQLMAITSPAAADKLWRQATQGVRSEELVYDVDCILHHRTSTITGQREYLVRWLGFSSIFDTWEPPSVLLTPNILSDYWGTAVNDLTLDSTSRRRANSSTTTPRCQL